LVPFEQDFMDMAAVGASLASSMPSAAFRIAALVEHDWLRWQAHSQRQLGLRRA
jgi:hypothetical protein